jgi:protein-S-isoprenylcysteine O-methyltransferase Ste14
MARQRRILTPLVLLQVLLFVVLVPFLPLLLSGRWKWWEAWAYAGVTILGFVLSRFLAARRHPDILAERARFMQHEDAKPWDRLLVSLLALASTSILVVAGLDARLGWSTVFGPPVKGVALAVIVAGYALGSYALIENRFFSGMVRIQSDRGHQVVSGGPYRWIRHPGYAGGLLTYLATPFLLDSSWAVIPAVLTAMVLLLRTRLEDTTLRSELPGYSDYARRVRFRILPGIW